jgi:hypothetical protein
LRAFANVAKQHAAIRHRLGQGGSVTGVDRLNQRALEIGVMQVLIAPALELHHLRGVVDVLEDIERQIARRRAERRDDLRDVSGQLN